MKNHVSQSSKENRTLHINKDKKLSIFITKMMIHYTKVEKKVIARIVIIRMKKHR